MDPGLRSSAIFCSRALFFFSLFFLCSCSSDNYLHKFDTLIKNGQFSQALQVLHEAPAADALNPELLLAHIEYLCKAPGAYRYARAHEYERRLINTAVPILQTIRTRLYSDENILFRFHLARVLHIVAYPDVRWQNIYEQAMIIALEAPDTDVRRDAVRAVARIPRKNPEGLVLLLGALLADTTEAVRLAAAEALQQELNVSSGKYVAMRALKSSDPRLVVQAMRTLGSMELPRKTLQVKLLPLTSHADTVIAAVAGRLCGKKPYKYDISLASSALRAEKTARILDVMSLSRLVSPENGGISSIQLAVFISHTDPAVRLAAIHAAVQYWPEFVIPTLLNRLNTEPDVQCRVALIDVLGRLRAEKAMPDLIAAFRSDIGRIRYESIIALGNIGASVVPAVIDSLASTNASVRKHSVIFLSNARDKRASEPLFKAFMIHDTEFALLAAQALISIRDSSLVDTLCSVAVGPDDIRALKAIQVLGEIGDARALGTLAKIDEPRERLFQAKAAVRKIDAQNAKRDSVGTAD